MEKYYSFAGIELCVAIPDEKMYTDDRHLTAFRVDVADDPHRYTFTLVELLTPPQGEELFADGGCRAYREGEAIACYYGSVGHDTTPAYMRVLHEGKGHTVQLCAADLPGRVGVHVVLTALGVEHLVVQQNGVILHASYVLTKDGAILFTAPSGTGKSTQAELWRTLRGAEVVNGDRAVIRWQDGGPMVCGLPFAGSSPYCRRVTAPLRAVVYLGQAPETTITRLGGVSAFRRVWEGLSLRTWDKSDVDRASEMVKKLIETVPVYHLTCLPDESAVIALEQRLQEDEG